ncbi:hypothetical protein [Cupriavidus neocaledonicus]|uniref:Uncharacterized protein n=1 Tax=Cupriavidus neocaledonicus TaxID=1040979 RepID=A0A375H481_9BURK|nr:hypothetical protein [Cupriavidus neocaledonicus]SOZ37120.1 hypothetical protein CBM2605_A60364 [Cupriavidus neocaledonicus]SPD45698.1 conserved protein of unknown function [Cupriavidus neocaledonicus]
MTDHPPNAPDLPAALIDAPGSAAAAPLPARFARPTLLLETLLATRLELLSRDHAWPPHTLAQRRAVLMRLWEQRTPGLFEQGGTADSIERCLQAAFAEAAGGRRLEAALQFKRAYYLVCCTASSGSRARLPGSGGPG